MLTPSEIAAIEGRSHMYRGRAQDDVRFLLDHITEQAASIAEYECMQTTADDCMARAIGMYGAAHPDATGYSGDTTLAWLLERLEAQEAALKHAQRAHGQWRVECWRLRCVAVEIEAKLLRGETAGLAEWISAQIAYFGATSAYAARVARMEEALRAYGKVYQHRRECRECRDAYDIVCPSGCRLEHEAEGLTRIALAEGER